MNGVVIIGGSDAGISAALHQGLHLDDLKRAPGR
jgi:thioredoxin reductase